ncbi:transforming growth factor beta like domain protein [Oesophagostomum dentatum]|uniref:Transforming growth factor beta like domain protein n=1 Tax=Oesophagostomum dentatum TaxID=61180 RepID=A0A0B1TKS7_OESDE|nr:transforming growth factor beta like domain protein [Oesophagostomum dentatum]
MLHTSHGKSAGASCKGAASALIAVQRGLAAQRRNSIVHSDMEMQRHTVKSVAASLDGAAPAPNTVRRCLASLKDIERPRRMAKSVAASLDDGFDRETLVARFPVSMTTMMRKVAKAYLHVYLYVDEPLSEPEPVEVVVRERRLNGELTKCLQVGDAVAKKTFAIQKSGKVVVPLKSFDVERWWRSEPILGLYVVAMLNGQNIAVHPQEDRHARHTMFMSVTLDSDSMSRRKRSPSVCMPEDQEPGCCLYDLTVDFQQMGWKFIIAPHKYNAYMCRGDCTLNHAHVARAGHTKVAKTGIITRQEATGNQGMCCHPAEYDAVRMIYMNADNQVTMARVPGMIARKCLENG